MGKRDVDIVGDERTMIIGFLDHHRRTFLSKVAGLSRDELDRRPPHTAMTLGGMTKHLALVEDTWFQERFMGFEPTSPWSDAPFGVDPDWDWNSAADDDPEYLMDLYRDACERSRLIVDAADSLDQLSVRPDRVSGGQFSLRWILLHMIEETAQHNGHADVLLDFVRR